ncbi:MAG TPA: ATP F0F1 synthase subunit B [Caulobacteraceae bacterium]|jgi:F-type H+-transporting ATPase subunit b
MDELIGVFTDPQNAHFWIFIALVVLVVVLLRAKIPAMAAKALDDAGARIQAQLDEAQRLRAEAETLLEQIHHRRDDSEKAAAKLMQTAEEDAARYREEAATKLAEDIARRATLAERKIAIAEAQAASDVRAAAVETAATIAEAVLTARMAGAKGDPSIDASLPGLARLRIGAN